MIAADHESHDATMKIQAAVRGRRERKEVRWADRVVALRDVLR